MNENVRIKVTWVFNSWKSNHKYTSYNKIGLLDTQGEDLYFDLRLWRPSRDNLKNKRVSTGHEKSDRKTT